MRWKWHCSTTIKSAMHHVLFFKTTYLFHKVYVMDYQLWENCSQRILHQFLLPSLYVKRNCVLLLSVNYVFAYVSPSDSDVNNFLVISAQRIFSISKYSITRTVQHFMLEVECDFLYYFTGMKLTTFFFLYSWVADKSFSKLLWHAELPTVWSPAAAGEYCCTSGI